jgi:hypothetical protein
LQRDDELERIARERFGLVKPGEEAYAVLPTPGRSGDPSGNWSPPQQEARERSDRRRHPRAPVASDSCRY